MTVDQSLLGADGQVSSASVLRRRTTLILDLGTSRPAMFAYSLAVFVALWETFAALVVRDTVFLPTPVATFKALIYYLHTPYPSGGATLVGDIGISLYRIGVGFAGGVVVGVTVGALIVTVPVFRALVEPWIQVVRSLPGMAFIPLLLIWFGLGETPKFVLVGFGTAPVVAVATAAAVGGVPDEILNTARCLGASERYVMLHVRIRAALPGIIVGLRLAMGVAWTSIVTVEFLAASSGIGYSIYQSGQFLVTSLLFAGLICIGVVAIGLDSVFRLVARRLDPTAR